jgi:hypothetical protein
MLQSILNNIQNAVDKLDIMQALQVGVEKALNKVQGLKTIFSTEVSTTLKSVDLLSSEFIEQKKSTTSFYKRCMQLVELLQFCSVDRAHNMEDVFIVGLVLFNETKGDDIGLLFWQRFIKQGPFYLALKPHLASMYQDFARTSAPLTYTTLIFFACNDSPDDFNKYCMSFNFSHK